MDGNHDDPQWALLLTMNDGDVDYIDHGDVDDCGDSVDGNQDESQWVPMIMISMINADNRNDLWGWLWLGLKSLPDPSFSRDFFSLSNLSSQKPVSYP